MFVVALFLLLLAWLFSSAILFWLGVFLLGASLIIYFEPSRRDTRRWYL